MYKQQEALEQAKAALTLAAERIKWYYNQKVQNFDNINGYQKPLRKPFKWYQKHLKAISIHRVISRLVSDHQVTRY